MKLDGRVAVVTGAASGIGRATAHALVARGCRLALVDVDEGGMKDVADEIAGCGGAASVHVADVGDASRMRELPEEVVAAHDAVHVLVNNAGVSIGGTLEEHRVEDFEWIVRTNLHGVFHGCRFFLPELRRADAAHIVNVSSVFGLIGLPSQSSYCATKAAIRSLSEALLSELAGTPVGVTCIYPAAVRTGIVEAAVVYDEKARDRNREYFARSGISSDRVARAIVRAVEKGRFRVMLSGQTRVWDALERLFPVATHRLVARIYRRRGNLV